MGNKVKTSDNGIKLMKNVNNHSFSVYITAMVVSFLMFMAVCCHYGDGYNRFTFFKLGEDVFMDFFNSVRDATQGLECYTERRVIYPPLANLYYLLCSRFMTDAFCNSGFHERLGFFDVRANILPYFVSTVVSAVVFVYVISRATKRKSFGGLLMAVFFIFNVSMLRLFERGNILILALIFTSVFLLYRDSDDKVIRELSYISLALAAGIKLYPALFGILLLFDKKFKDAIRTCIYGILAFALPFAFYDGMDGFKAWLDNLKLFSSMKSGGVEIEGSTSLDTIFYIFKHFGIDVHVPSFVSTLMVVLPILLLIFYAFLTDIQWKKVLAITVAMILCPGAGQSYTMVFFLIPLLLMMEAKEIKIIDYAYFIIITCEFLYYPFPFILKYEVYPVNSGMTFFVVLGILVVTIVETVCLIKERFSRKKCVEK